MEATTRKLTAFWLDTGLVERLRQNARRENRSLNNYVETLLMDAAYRTPNATTRAAIEEARSGKAAGTLRMDSFDEFMDSVNSIE